MQEDETPDAVHPDFGIRYDDDGTVHVRFSGQLKDEIPEELQPEPRYVHEKDDVVHFTIPSPEAAEDPALFFNGDADKLQEAYEAAQYLNSRLGDFNVNLLGELLIAIQHVEEYQDSAGMEDWLEKLFDQHEFNVEVEVITRRKDDNNGK